MKKPIEVSEAGIQSGDLIHRDISEAVNRRALLLVMTEISRYPQDSDVPPWFIASSLAEEVGNPQAVSLVDVYRMRADEPYCHEHIRRIHQAVSAHYAKKLHRPVEIPKLDKKVFPLLRNTAIDALLTIRLYYEYASGNIPSQPRIFSQHSIGAWEVARIQKDLESNIEIRDMVADTISERAEALRMGSHRQQDDTVDVLVNPHRSRVPRGL